MTPTALDPLPQTSAFSEGLLGTECTESGFADLLFASMFDRPAEEVPGSDVETDGPEVEATPVVCQISIPQVPQAEAIVDVAGAATTSSVPTMPDPASASAPSGAADPTGLIVTPARERATPNDLGGTAGDVVSTDDAAIAPNTAADRPEPLQDFVKASEWQQHSSVPAGKMRTETSARDDNDIPTGENQSTVEAEPANGTPVRTIDARLREQFQAIHTRHSNVAPASSDQIPFASREAVLADASERIEEPGRPGERTELTDSILSRFEARRNPDLAANRPESRLPVATRAVEQVRDQIVTFVPAHLAKEGKEILKMRLHPAELGQVEIEIERDPSGAISAQIRTESESAQHILVEGLNELRDSLKDSGIDVGRLEVSTSLASSTSSGDKDGRGTEPRRTGVGEFAEGNFAHVDLDHGNDIDDRLVSLRA